MASGPDVPVAGRRATVLLPGVDAAAARTLLGEARFEARKPHTIWIQAEAARRLVGKMACGADAGVTDADALGDVVVCTARPSTTPPMPWYAEYRVTIPHAGRWTLWARVRYPGGGDQSFGIVRPGEGVTLTGRQVLGNCGVNAGRWHWTGRGGGLTTKPPGQRIVYALPAGEVTFRVYAREGPGSAQANPRLDCLCLTDGDEAPTDANARQALNKH